MLPWVTEGYLTEHGFHLQDSLTWVDRVPMRLTATALGVAPARDETLGASRGTDVGRETEATGC